MKLKPCPFCGSAKVGEHWPNDLIVMVRCTKCKAEGPITVTEIGAKRMWNRRAAPPASRKEGEK